ncbi:hypothetical protein IJ596_05570 [bacterium]|nr:hypothetical protein [bacterium]
MNKNYNNMLILGLIILVCGIFLLIYSFSSHMEVQNLATKIDFDELDHNNQMSTSDKYYKHLFYAETLEKKLKKNANIPFKNASCVYLDFAQHNVVSMYKLIFNAGDFEDDRKDVVEEKVDNLYEILDKYITCKQTADYKSELKNIQNEIAKSEEQYENSLRDMDIYTNMDTENAEYGEGSEIQPAGSLEEGYKEQETIIPQVVEPGNTY